MQLILVCIISCLAENPIYKLINFYSTNTTAKLKVNTNTKYVENLKGRLEWLYKTANEVVKKKQEQSITDTMIRKLDVQN